MKLAIGQSVILTTGDLCTVERRHQDGSFTLSGPGVDTYRRRWSGDRRKSSGWSKEAVARYSLRGERGQRSPVIRVTPYDFEVLSPATRRLISRLLCSPCKHS